MEKKYETLSGEKIDLSQLAEDEQKHISGVEELIGNSADYFEVERAAFAPLKEGKSFDVKRLTELHGSLRYKVLLDMVERYGKRQNLYG